MFNQNPRRNLRQRKNESSDEDENDKLGGGDAGKETEKADSKADLARGGISSSSKTRECDCSDADDEPSVTALQSRDIKQQPKSNTLGFLDEKDSTEESFSVKRSVNREVVFQARKKEGCPASLPSFQVKKSNEDVSVRSDSDSDGSAEDIPPDSDDGSSSTMSSSSGSSKAQKVIIPDARKICAAKEKRRQARAQQDYISLDSPHTPGSLQEEGPSSGEQNSDNELDDHERRIEFAPKPKTLRERMAEKMGSDSDESFSDSQEEEDQQMWEEQQIGKGVKRHQKEWQAPRPARQKKMDIPETLPPVSIDVIKKRIIAKLDSLREVHRVREAELRRMQLDMEMAKSSLESLENYTTEEQLRFYSTMNVFSRNLLECLSKKMALINSVELDMHSLYFDQAEVLLSQRREALQEESSQIQKLTYNTDSHSNGDTTGGSNPIWQSLSEEEIGCVPCDWEPTAEQQVELQSKRDDLLKKAQEVFADVQTDFWDVKKILSRFDEWRVSFQDSYSNAYIGLCIPKLLAPLIRHQLIDWNPLQAGEDFEALPWYSAVERFCHGQGYEESENMDKTTLPTIIEKTIVSKVQVQLLGNMALWDGLIPEHILKQLMLEKLLGRYLMITVLNESDPKHTIQKCKKIADCFPKSWFIDLNTGSSLPQLQNFSKHLLQIAHAIFKDNNDSSSTRKLLSDVLFVLKNIKAHDSIRTITEKCQCEDLLKALQ
ncbi:GC-rich sequence DNA-binding factor 2-like [Sinocyclocheilus anshuiensis]|uniref:GC-rich sequence DNA-binding factor 2-like n=1 Tax=Sinocyclocheilus anshuiensis TaxID=1608454 RepID=UPI0007B97CB4|nr:PREDICTED: GC-rich sequence DNA-binding factor 2-like [Sinocyclocheilus anshuiensis]